jgi:TonB family protein
MKILTLALVLAGSLTAQIDQPPPRATVEADNLSCTFSIQLRSMPVIRVNSPIPRPINQPLPDYPIAMRIHAVTGDVKLRLKIGPDGAVENITVLSADNSVFESVTKAAVNNWRFSETLRNRRRSPVEVDYTFEFRMLFEEDDGVVTRPNLEETKSANQTLVPTVTSVTPAADAPVAPAAPAAHL